MLVHLSYTGESGGDGENRTLIGWVQTSSPPVERRPHGCGGGNRTHLLAAYETAVRASSPQQNPSGRAGKNHFDVERVTGFEPVSGPWQGPILAARRYAPGASGEQEVTLALHTLTHIHLSKSTLRRQRRDG